MGLETLISKLNRAAEKSNSKAVCILFAADATVEGKIPEEVWDRYTQLGINGLQEAETFIRNHVLPLSNNPEALGIYQGGSANDREQARRLVAMLISKPTNLLLLEDPVIGVGHALSYISTPRGSIHEFNTAQRIEMSRVKPITVVNSITNLFLPNRFGYTNRVYSIGNASDLS